MTAPPISFVKGTGGLDIRLEADNIYSKVHASNVIAQCSAEAPGSPLSPNSPGHIS